MIVYNKNIDQVDKKIILLLQSDASLSIKEISSKIGLSPSPCWNRIQKLQKQGVIKKKTAILDPNKLGYANRDWSDKFKKYILEQNNVLGLYRISGAYDYIIDVLSKNIKDFDIFYQNLIKNIEIFEVSSSFVMEVMKETTSIPLID